VDFDGREHAADREVNAQKNYDNLIETVKTAITIHKP